MSLSLDLDRVEIRPEAGFASAQAYDDGRLRAHFIPGAGRIELETIQLESEAVTLAALCVLLTVALPALLAKLQAATAEAVS